MGTATPNDPPHGEDAGENPTDDTDTQAGQPGAAALSPLELDILAFEHLRWRYPGARDAAIRERFAMTSTRYYQVLNALIDRPEALIADPLLVRRLQRLRAARRDVRTSSAGDQAP